MFSLGHRRSTRRNQPSVEQSLDFVVMYPIRQDLSGVDLYRVLDVCERFLLIKIRLYKNAAWPVDPQERVCYVLCF
jgi:hypothetical protein